MGVARRVAYKLVGPRLPLWEDLARRHRVDKMRGDGRMLTPIDAAIATLRLRDLMPAEPLRALELFGRMGIWKTLDYVGLCESLDFYEIEPHFARAAKSVLPKNTSVHCTDSIAAVHQGLLPRADYNFVLLDNGVGEIYGDSYCEHFDLLPRLFDFVSHDAVIIANLFRTTRPGSDFDSTYVRRRTLFYRAADPMRPTVDEVVAAYRALLPPRLQLRDAFTVAHPRHPKIPHNEMHFVVLKLGSAVQPS